MEYIVKLIPESRKPILQGWAKDFTPEKIVQERAMMEKNIKLFEEAIASQRQNIEELDYIVNYQAMIIVDRKK